jgi:pyruvate dehydrogenase E2 component (dihydrolipoamide acetyltransferase)
MAIEITMPKLSDTMTEGRLISWKKVVGDRVDRGEIIAEVETDKATMELESFSSGVLLEIRIKPGETAPVGTVMALVGAAGEKGTAGPVEEQDKEETKTEQIPDAEKREGEGEAGEWKQQEPGAVAADERAEAPAAEGLPPEKKGPPDVEGKPAPSGAYEKASPLVRRLAREKGIDLANMQGSGPEGRILREDLEKSVIGNREPGVGKSGMRDADSGTEKRTQQDAAIGIGVNKAAVVGDLQPFSRMRGAIARTVAEAWRTIPHFSVTVEVEMGEAERVRQELKSSGNAVSLNDFIIKAAATAIGAFPRINASFSADGMTMHPVINIGIAVALDDGLLVPVVRGCEALPLREIAVRSRELIKRAKAGTISEAEITGGTFSISNLGMFGVDGFSAVIHPPQGAILAVGAVMDRPVIKEGHLAAARMMHMTLSADHRLIDGAYAAKFLREMKRVLENPVTMLV